MTGTHTHGSPSPGTQPPPGRHTNVLDSFEVPYAHLQGAGLCDKQSYSPAETVPT